MLRVLLSACLIGLIPPVSAVAQTCVCDPNATTPCVFPGLTIAATDSSGAQNPSKHTRDGAISEDGRWLTFRSTSRLFAGTSTYPQEQIYLKDLSTGTLTLVSESLTGGPSNDTSFDPVISQDGRRVAFVSESNDLVPETTTQYPLVRQVYIYDHVVGTLEIVTASAAGVPGDRASSLELSFSPDGQDLLFVSQATNLIPTVTDPSPTLFVKNFITGDIEPIAPNLIEDLPGVLPTAYSEPIFSGTGFEIAYSPSISQVPARQIVVHDLLTDEARIVTTRTNGELADGNSEMPVFSDNGRYLLFISTARNLTSVDPHGDRQAYVKDLLTGGVELVSRTSSGEVVDGNVWTATISYNGRYVAFTTDSTNARPNRRNRGRQVYIFDRNSDTLELVSTAYNGGRVSNDAELSRFAFDGAGQLVFEGRSNNYVEIDLNGTRGNIFRTSCLN